MFEAIKNVAAKVEFLKFEMGGGGIINQIHLFSASHPPIAKAESLLRKKLQMLNC